MACVGTYQHTCMRVCIFKGFVHLSVCMWGVSSIMNYRDHITSYQLQPPSSPCPFSFLQSTSFTLLPKHHESGCGMYCMSVQQRIFTVYSISPLLEKQRMFCWGLFSVSASVIPIRLPSVPAYGFPSAKPQEMRYSYHPRGV